jgi:hypothetical protein
MVLPAPDGTFIVWCESCPRSFEVATETAAELVADIHNRRDARWDYTMEYVTDLAARPRPAVDDRHVHSFRCTFEVCGTGPTRAALVEVSKKRRGL